MDAERIERAPNFQERQLRMSEPEQPQIMNEPTGALGFSREQIEHPHLALPHPTSKPPRNNEPKSNPGTAKRSSIRANPATNKQPHTSNPATTY